MDGQVLDGGTIRVAKKGRCLSGASPTTHFMVSTVIGTLESTIRIIGNTLPIAVRQCNVHRLQETRVLSFSRYSEMFVSKLSTRVNAFAESGQVFLRINGEGVGFGTQFGGFVNLQHIVAAHAAACGLEHHIALTGHIQGVSTKASDTHTFGFRPRHALGGATQRNRAHGRHVGQRGARRQNKRGDRKHNLLVVYVEAAKVRIIAVPQNGEVRTRFPVIAGHFGRFMGRSVAVCRIVQFHQLLVEIAVGEIGIVVGVVTHDTTGVLVIAMHNTRRVHIGDITRRCGGVNPTHDTAHLGAVRLDGGAGVASGNGNATLHLPSNAAGTVTCGFNGTCEETLFNQPTKAAPDDTAGEVTCVAEIGIHHTYVLDGGIGDSPEEAHILRLFHIDTAHDVKITVEGALKTVRTDTQSDPVRPAALFHTGASGHVTTVELDIVYQLETGVQGTIGNFVLVSPRGGIRGVCRGEVKFTAGIHAFRQGDQLRLGPDRIRVRLRSVRGLRHCTHHKCETNG